MKIILASSSPNRKALLDKLNFQYATHAPTFEEVIDTQLSNHDNIKAFAKGKALSVYSKYKQELNILILGFDSMIEIDGKILGKAHSEEEAFNMIKNFVGKKQKVTSGISLVGNFEGNYFEKTDLQSTTVQFRSDITDYQIKAYLAFNDWSGKCGAYSILGMGQFLLEEVQGDFQNIIGVPVLKMGAMIQEITKKNPLELFLPQFK